MVEFKFHSLCGIHEKHHLWTFNQFMRLFLTAFQRCFILQWTLYNEVVGGTGKLVCYLRHRDVRVIWTISKGNLVTVKVALLYAV